MEASRAGDGRPRSATVSATPGQTPAASEPGNRAPSGDGWHATSKDPAQLREGLGRLRAVADKHNRDMNTISATA
ncbi:MAG: hypothetical protein WAP47_03545 [Candidatus Rokuibacteriota bacterium]